MQHIKTSIIFRAFRETGTLILFYPEGRTYSPLAERQAVVVRSARRIRLLRKPTDNEAFIPNRCHCPHRRLFSHSTPSVCENLPQAVLSQMSIVFLYDTHFLFAKRNKNREDDDIYWQYTTLKQR